MYTNDIFSATKVKLRLSADDACIVSIPKKSKNKHIFIDQVRNEWVRFDQVRYDWVRNDQ